MTPDTNSRLPWVLADRIGKTGRVLSERVRASAYPGASAAWTGRMTLVAVFAWLGVALIHPFDAQVVDAAEHGRALPLVFLREVTNVGRSTAYLVAALAVMTAISLADWKGMKRRVRGRLALFYGQATFAFAAIALSGLTTDLVKIVVGRARPKFLATLGPDYRSAFRVGYDFASFPSGHATTLGAIAAILALWFPRWRVPIALAAFVLAFSRCAAGAHYPSDVWAGFVFGYLFTVFLARLLARRAAGFRFADGRLMPELRFRKPSKVPH